MKPSGYILWRGPSRLRPSREVVAICTVGRSRNPKTGAMPQVWILDVRQNPADAYIKGSAASDAMCGDCKHRGDKIGSCYVKWYQAPLAVWRKFKRGGYPPATLAVWRTLRRQGVRMGAAGDPAALPVGILRALRPATAYTHQWKHPEFQELKSYVMASVDTPRERNMARALGWRAFEVTIPGDEVPKTSIVCPTEYRDIQCDDCRLCCGTTLGAKDISIPVHGKIASRFVTWRRAQGLKVLG